MKIGILETGGPPGGLAERFGDYPDMVRRLLGDGHAFTTYDVARDEPPAIPETQDAYGITGSPAGVYDGLPWIMRLIEWLREAQGRTTPVGMCTGEQVMAQAVGGTAATQAEKRR